MDGIIVVDKPQGMTSHDVVNKMRKITGVSRIGHTGTLDPIATGLLNICIGRATKMVEFMQNDGSPDAKGYECSMKLGMVTDTGDISGEVISGASSGRPAGIVRELGTENIAAAVLSFIGPGMQTPPKYSAIKYQGRKLYDYARAGDDIPREAIVPREIIISDIKITLIDETDDIVEFVAYCSKGTYIRTLCCDIGDKLGCGAAMSSLRRIKNNAFTIDMAIPLSRMDDGIDEKMLLPVEAGLGFMQVLQIPGNSTKYFLNGRIIPAEMLDTEARSIFTGITDNDDMLVRVHSEGSFLGIGRVTSQGLTPRKQWLIS